MTRMKQQSVGAILSLCLLLAGAPGLAQESEILDTQGVVEAVARTFAERYVVPEMAVRMRALLESKLERGEYSAIRDLDHLAAQLTEDLRALSEDGHIALYRIQGETFFKAENETLSEEDIARHRRDNSGFRKVEQLRGNLGYLKLDYFGYPEIGGPTASAAMAFVSSCDALIVDLRTNRGGKETMVRFLLSYLFAEPTHFLTVYDRSGTVFRQSWSLPYVPGPTLFSTPVYVLTSSSTGSGGEAFAYHLQSYGRATIVGETTRGIAHWVDSVDFPEYQLRVHVPYARPVNPVTGTSWEGTGVVPDLNVSAAQALPTAHALALRKLLESAGDEERRRDLKWDLAAVEGLAQAGPWSPERLAEYTGIYDDGKRSVVLEEGQLVYCHSAKDHWPLVPLNAELFGFDDTDDPRVKIVRDRNGAVSGFQLIFKNGSSGSIHTRTGDLDPH